MNFNIESCERVSTPKPPLSRSERIAKLSADCEAAIYAGVDVETSQGKKHFSLKPHDQTELMALKPQLEALIAQESPAEAIPYHADGELCRLWTAADFGIIFKTAMEHVFYHRTYCNHVMEWARRAKTKELSKIVYGAELPADLAENMRAILAAGEV